MELSTKANGSRIKPTETEYSGTMMETFILVNFQEIRLMDLVFISIKMEECMKASGSVTTKKAKEKKSGKMIRNMSVATRTE